MKNGLNVNFRLSKSYKSYEIFILAIQKCRKDAVMKKVKETSVSSRVSGWLTKVDTNVLNLL